MPPRIRLALWPVHLTNDVPKDAEAYSPDDITTSSGAESYSRLDEVWSWYVILLQPRRMQTSSNYKRLA